ncbi:decapping and exoribonuclease protein-like [Paramacrobiotus metropolitanus]|uniref:decapping and exoribonuclease protein-like n=1 Tax=Paramacrobiotus metropolitanus TaxID=2943436 RepID=UPI002445F199|nr:decapping and exoribonuclease protein-like [Paramacrobiotus metropolitanus]
MYSRGNRGRGRGGRGYSGGPGWRNAQSDSDGDGAFSIHPRSKFQRMGISTNSIQLEEVGFYSLYGDTEEELVIRSDRSKLRAMTVRCDADAPTPVHFNLDAGFNTARKGRYVVFNREMRILYQWLEEHADDDRIRRLRHDTKILVSKSLLSELIKIPYGQDASNATGYIFGAAKIGGKVILGKIQRPDIDITALKSPDHVRNLEDDRGAYRGRRYEVYMTALGDGADSDDIGVDLPRYRSVMKLRFRDIDMLIESAIDGIDPNSSAPGPGKYVDFTIMLANVLENEMKLYRQRLFRWWTNNIFIGVGNVHVGVHEDGVVNEVYTYHMNDIPQLVKEKEEELGRPLWNAETSLGFTYSLLKFVLNSVVEDCRSFVYEITSCKETGKFSCTAVPTESAVGHVYIPDNLNTFIF